MPPNLQDTLPLGTKAISDKPLADPITLANHFGEWTKALIRMLGWTIAMVTALSAAYIAIRLLLFEIGQAHQLMRW